MSEVIKVRFCSRDMDSSTRLVVKRDRRLCLLKISIQSGETIQKATTKVYLYDSMKAINRFTLVPGMNFVLVFSKLNSNSWHMGLENPMI